MSLQSIQLDSLQIDDHLEIIAEKLATTPVTTLMSDLIDKAVNFGLKLLAAMLIYVIGAWIIRKVKRLISRIFEKKKTDTAFVSFLQSIISITLYIMLIIITIGAVGIDTTSIAALLAGGGMAIGLALNGTVQNFAGGMMIIAFKPFKAGDYIEAQGYAGTVTEVSIVNTRLTTGDNKSIIIPNGALFNGTINNYSERNLRRVEWTICVEYGTSAQEVKDALLSLINTETRILHTVSGAPADPFVALSELGASSVNFIMRAWVKSSDYWDVRFSVNERIYEELPEKGINFPFPQMDVHVHQN